MALLKKTLLHGISEKIVSPQGTKRLLKTEGPQEIKLSTAFSPQGSRKLSKKIDYSEAWEGVSSSSSHLQKQLDAYPKLFLLTELNFPK